MPLHLIKLCVGCDTVEDLLAWRQVSSGASQPWTLRTRQTPRRAAELVAGGSIYRVYKGFILSRQRILAVDTIGAGPAKRCEMILDETLVLTAPTPRRAFQGWGYLAVADAPPDLELGQGGGVMPTTLARQLRQMGAW